MYGVDLASFGVALVSVLLLPGLPPCRGGQPASLASLIGGITHMWSSQPLAGIFVIDLGAMVFGLPRAVFPPLAATLYGGGAATVGYLNAAPGAGGPDDGPGHARPGPRRRGRGDRSRAGQEPPDVVCGGATVAAGVGTGAAGAVVAGAAARGFRARW